MKIVNISGVNSGVMLMNLTRLRASSWLHSMSNYYKEYRLKITWGDQDLINIYFHYYPGMFVYEKMFIFLAWLFEEKYADIVVGVTQVKFLYDSEYLQNYCRYSHETCDCFLTLYFLHDRQYILNDWIYLYKNLKCPKFLCNFAPLWSEKISG